MRSRAVRLTISAVAFMALAAAAFFLFQSETQIAERRRAVRAVDLRARDGVDRLAELRAAGARKLVYGSDMPVVCATYQIGRVLLAPIPEDDKRCILGGTLAALLATRC